MTDAECAETLSEFRKLTLGPELSAALDHAIGVLRSPHIYVEQLRGGDMKWTPPPYVADSRAIDLAAA